MAWTCTAGSNAKLIDNLFAKRLIKSSRIRDAMTAVDRALFCKDPAAAYQDSPQPIGFNATISAPHMHAIALELLEPNLQEGMKVLDVGSGSGYLVACLALLVSPGGSVVGVEHIPGLHEMSVRNCDQWVKAGFSYKNLPAASLAKCEFYCCDGRLGYEAGAPYDAIHVGAAAPTLPQPLIDQLKPGGRLVCPVGPDGGAQELMQVDKNADGTGFTVTSQGGVRFVPLTDEAKQWRS